MKLSSNNGLYIFQTLLLDGNRFDRSVECTHCLWEYFSNVLFLFWLNHSVDHRHKSLNRSEIKGLRIFQSDLLRVVCLIILNWMNSSLDHRKITRKMLQNYRECGINYAVKYGKNWCVWNWAGGEGRVMEKRAMKSYYYERNRRYILYGKNGEWSFFFFVKKKQKMAFKERPSWITVVELQNDKVEIHCTCGIPIYVKNNERSLFHIFIYLIKLLHHYCHVKPNNRKCVRKRFKNVTLCCWNLVFVSFLFESDISKIDCVKTSRTDGNDSPGQRFF